MQCLQLPSSIWPSGPGKQIVEDFAFVYFQHIELLSYFPIDAAMHPVLKNLGITDKVISFILESVNGNKVKKKKAEVPSNIKPKIE